MNGDPKEFSVHGPRFTAHHPLLWTIRCAAALGFTSLSLTGEISVVYRLLAWSAWGLSFWLDRYPEWEERLQRWENLAVVILVAVFGLDFFAWGFSLFISVAHFLILFQVFKLLGLKTRKDCLQILIFSFFQLLSACTLSVDAWQALIFLLLIPIATAGLFWQQMSREVELFGQSLPPSTAKPYRRLLTIMCLSAVPINLILGGMMFMIFPRLAFRGAFAGVGAGRSGYNEQVDLAQTGTLSLDNSPVLWLEITPPQDRKRWKGYLRGATLDHFDGKHWSRNPGGISQTMYADSNGIFKLAIGARAQRGLRQSITLVNTSGVTLFGSPYIGEIVAPLATLQQMHDGSVRWARGWRKPLHYDVVSFDQPFGHYAPQTHKGPKLLDYLQLPELSLKRTQLLLRQITNQRAPAAQAQAIERYLREHYQYSLDQGDQARDNPVEDFLFVRRRGPCGHFASAMAILLRLKGIPARVVAGYYQGTWNSQVQQYLFRERDAHAWVEAYLPNKGWVLFDPSPRGTPPAAAQRWILRFQETWGYLTYQWDRLVIEYDLYSQVQTLQDIQSNTNRVNAAIGGWIDRYLMGSRKPNADRSGQNVERPLSAFWNLRSALILLTALGILSVFHLRKRGRLIDPQILFYQRFLHKMARKGFPKTPAETGWEYADRLREQIGPDPVLSITQRYYVARFRAQK